MKRLSIPIVMVSMFVGLIACAVIQHTGGCAASGTGLGAPTTQQADAFVATAQQDLAQSQQVLTQLQAAAATQPSNAEITKQIASVQTAITKYGQPAVTSAQAIDQAVYHGDVSGLSSLVAGAVPAPYGLLAALGITIGYGIYQRVKSGNLQTAHAQVSTALDAATGALQQYAQTVHAVVPDAQVAQISQLVDSTTRAAVAAAGVVHIPDASALTQAIAQPLLQGAYTLGLSTNGASK